MLREGVPIGAILVRRLEVRPFSEKQIALLKTFADQAVIAIENVRLFKELQERNRDLTEALEQQTATGEILRVIASSPTELQPVLDTLLANAVKLSGATKGHIRQYDGEFLTYVAHYNESAEIIDALVVVCDVCEKLTVIMADMALRGAESFAAFARRVCSNTGWSSVGEDAMTRRTSPVSRLLPPAPRLDHDCVLAIP